MSFKCHRQRVGSSYRVTFNNHRVEQHEIKCAFAWLNSPCKNVALNLVNLWTVGKKKTRNIFF